MTRTRLPLLGNALESAGPIPLDSISYLEARAQWGAFRIAGGYGQGAVDFTAGEDSNAKLALSGHATRSLTLAAADASGVVDSCANRTASCTMGCVVMHAGRGDIPTVLRGRISRTLFLYRHPAAAVALIAGELRRSVAAAGDTLVRLNVASDLPWESIAPELFTIEGVRAYDYTKVPSRVQRPIDNYRLVFSVSEAPHADATAVRYMTAGGTAAVVFGVRKGEPLPDTWNGFPVVDGDLSDDRTADPRGVVIGLRVKGKGKRLPVGPREFVRPPDMAPAAV